MKGALAADMIGKQLRRRGIRDVRVLNAMLAIPREEFVAPWNRARAYADEASAIGYGQTITQPYMTALMAQSLALTGTEKVLDVGTGSGYHAAVLARLARRVISIERIPELAELARANLDAAGCCENVKVVCGDGSLGFRAEAPFDAISVAAGSPAVPPALLDQLGDPGRLVIPIGSQQNQELQLVTKQGGKISTKNVTGCRFVPLVGEQGWQQ